MTGCRRPTSLFLFSYHHPMADDQRQTGKRKPQKRQATTPRFRWNSRSMQPRVSIEDKEAVFAILDEKRRE